MEIDFEFLWRHVTSQLAERTMWLHGPDHWRRVERNGLLLAAHSHANVNVVRLFALFHDSRRENDGWDPDHGARGAEFAKTLRGAAFQLTDNEFELLHYACVWHTAGTNHNDATIATCWDADRLDLGRVGITPDPKRMCTEFGRKLATAGSVEAYINSVNLAEDR
jgi:uncharacterized protein